MAFPSYCQFYLRGEVKDEKNNYLTGVSIFVHSSRTMYKSGIQGSFGINVPGAYDSLSFSLAGYEALTLRVKTNQWQTIALKSLTDNASKSKQKLLSLSTDLSQSAKFNTVVNDETYFQLAENEFVNAEKYPNTGFSLDVDKASYSNIRRFINTDSKVPPDAVRIEEIINYFNLQYRPPASNEIFNIRSQLSNCPWNTQHQLLFLSISAKKLDLEKVPPGNFVFLIDASGSMDMPNRLPLIKAALQSFVNNLRPVDKVSIVVYGGDVGIWLKPTSGAEKSTIIKSIEELTAFGATPGESGIKTAYKLAETSFLEGGNNRVILATDGDFNIGETSEKAMEELITKMSKTGVYLTCLGVGMGNFKDSKLQTLAKKGNGNYAYLDNLREAEKVLVNELTQTMYVVADDVFINMQFNPSLVKQYRLIGFDNKRDALADSSSALNGGEVGSGNSTLAIFEIEPSASPQTVSHMASSNPLAKLSLFYSPQNEHCTDILHYQVSAGLMPFDSIETELRFAAALTLFGLTLKQSKYIPKSDWFLIQNLADQSVDKSNYLQNEFLQLVKKAEKVYSDRKRKRRE